ncbi:hypothetical protein BDB01DRAFT_785799 [Pilobolus umbonatus]|nr:hypothetical protein BDB01DRAFT_785799 [Pilobolus umbonatus]
MQVKRPWPSDFMSLEDDDEDYLIAQSIDLEEEIRTVGLGDYMKEAEGSKTVDTLNQLIDTDTGMYSDMDGLVMEAYTFEEDKMLFGTGKGKQPMRAKADFIDDDMDDLILEAYKFEEEKDDFLFGQPLAKQQEKAALVDAMDSMDIDGNTLFDIDVKSIRKRSTQYRHTPVQKVAYTPVDYNHMPESGSFITGRCPGSGSRLYFPKKIDRKNRKRYSLKETVKNTSVDGLLEIPLWKLRENVEKKNKALLEAIQREINEQDKRPKKKKRNMDSADQHSLWVDKYRSTNYMDLMSDEDLNRSVLKWVKQWDYCVFKKALPRETQRDKMLRLKKENANGSYQPFTQAEDPFQRPHRKILLLSGPPGFGKTTLAHIVARQAGYNIIEINASDDRTSDVVKHKIKSALEMQAIIKESKDGTKTTVLEQKPNLIIIDEIDGASGSGGSDSFIKQLVNMASAEIGTNKKGKEKEKPLLRPIICICNDAFAPVLRPLRAIAQFYQFKRPPTVTIAKRLHYVCKNEDLDTNLGTLNTLVELADGDMRSCLNTLQFIRGKSSSFNKEMLSTSGVGQKDMGQNLFKLWEEIFNAPNARFKAYMTNDDLDDNRYVSRLVEAVEATGDIERVMQGCYEAYPYMRFHDVALEKVVKMNEWMEFYDTINHYTNNKHEYELFKYLPYPAVNFHRFFAGTSMQEHHVQYPKLEYEHFVTMKSYENLLTLFLNGLSPLKRRELNTEFMASTLIPALIHILSPNNLVSANKTLLKAEEKESLSRIVQLMIEYGLTYVQERTEDGLFVYRLEPPIEELLNFESTKSVLPKEYAMRQLISQEIEIELTRRREAHHGKMSSKKQMTTAQFFKVKGQEKVVNKAPVDFFGRIIHTKNDTRKKKVPNKEITPITYKYLEGVTNGLRKPMLLRDFI